MSNICINVYLTEEIRNTYFSMYEDLQSRYEICSCDYAVPTAQDLYKSPAPFEQQNLEQRKMKKRN